MKDQLTPEQTASILKALKEAIDQGPWSDSNFLKLIGKNLCDIRDRFVSELQGPGLDASKEAAHHANKMALRSGQREVFIALYAFDGNNIQSWERMVFNLPNQVTSRPIYANEQDVQALIKTKTNKNNEAYVTMFIQEGDILMVSPDKTLVDRLGKPLLMLKNKTLRLDNVGRFVHVSGTYHFAHGRLVKQVLVVE